MSLSVHHPGPKLCMLVPASREVHFASSVEIMHFDRYDDTGLFYTHSECQDMKIENARDIREARRKHLMLSSISRGPSTMNEEDFSCTLHGMENFISPILMRKMTLCKRQSRMAVIEEQTRQLAVGENSPWKIASAYLRHTQDATEQAHKIGVFSYKGGDLVWIFV